LIGHSSLISLGLHDNLFIMHRKASPIFHNGLKILRLSDLSYDQSHLFSAWIKPAYFITLGDHNDHDCVSYENYEYWYQNHYVTEKDMDFMI
jgi:hypothetical protein